MDPQSIINALAAKGFLYNSGNDEVGPYFVMNGRAYTPEEAAAAIGVPASQVKQAAQASSFVPQLNQASQAAGMYPSSGGGFFSGLLNMVSDVGGGLSGAVANPVASALNVSPDLVRAAMLGAGALYGGGLLGGAEAGAAPAAAGAAPAATGAALGAEGLAVPATLGATAFPVAAVATPAFATEAAALGAEGLAAPATLGAGALDANALAAATGAEGLAVPASNALAAPAATPAAAADAGSVMSPGEGIDASIGRGMTEAGVGTGLTAPALASLAKFAKDYGIPLAALTSGLTGAYTAKSAAQTQADAARYAADQAYKVFQEQKALQEPFRTAGIGAQNQLLTLLGLPGGTQGAEFGKYARPFGMQDFQADPGYAFRLSEGLKALEASRAAQRGGATGLLSGATGKALQRYGQDLASQEYGSAFNRYQTERANRLAPLGSLTNLGQAAATNMVGSAGQYGTNVGNLTTDIGATQAAGQLGAAKAVSNALGTYMNYLGNQDLANAIAQQRRQSQYSV